MNGSSSSPSGETLNLSVVGLGKLGLCMAGCLAEAGYPVTGVDISKNLIAMINNGEVPYIEPELDRVLALAKPHLKATSDYEEAILNTDTTFIVVATPTMPDGTYGNDQLEAALTSIAEVLPKKEQKHRIVISCTVMPGTIDREMIPLIEKVSGKKLGEGFSVAYNPEFIAMGDVIRIFTNPDFVLVGESDNDIGETLEKIYKVMCPNDPPVSRMSIINAELAKISLNCFVTTKITYANMLAEVCEALPGANVDVVSKAIGQDERIGSKVLRGGLGFGGPCFPRDNRAFVRLAKDYGVDAALAQQTHLTNRWQEERIRNILNDLVEEGATVAILGIAYKPHTPLIEESQALNLAVHLADQGFRVRVHDPVALDNAKQEIGDKLEYCDSIHDALTGADVAVITMMDDQYKSLNSSDFVSMMNENGVVFDLWRLYYGQSFDGLRYKPLGVGKETNPLSERR